MKASSHPFPARMRLRFAQLKGEPLAAARLAGAVRQLDGVLAADASATTGSMQVTYRVDVRREPGFLAELEQVLERHGLSGQQRNGAPQAPVAGCGAASQDAGARLVGAIVDKLLERSALALVAALL